MYGPRSIPVFVFLNKLEHNLRLSASAHAVQDELAPDMAPQAHSHDEVGAQRAKDGSAAGKQPGGCWPLSDSKAAGRLHFCRGHCASVTQVVHTNFYSK